MRIDNKKIDLLLLLLFVLVILGLPFGIWTYDRHVRQGKLPAETRIITLTGHTRQGWILGEIQAHDVISFGISKRPPEKPVIEVSKGDSIVLRLKSSDVVHGFSLKDFGIFITDGIQPGKVVQVSFTADKTGTFTFSCNAICGDNHKNMQGTLIVRA